MFGIGFQEMLIILVVVLIFFGPKRLPDLAKSLGKGIAEFKKASEEVRQGINDAMKEEPPKQDAAAGATAPATPLAEPPAAPATEPQAGPAVSQEAKDQGPTPGAGEPPPAAPADPSPPRNA